MTFGKTDSENESILYKFLLLRISGEPQVVTMCRNLENWGDLKESLKNTYMEK
jgi:hypothetical protein